MALAAMAAKGGAMWTTYKTKDGETLDAIAKTFKLKDAKPLLDHPKNKAAAALHKKKQPLPKNSVVWVPDPKVKCFVYKIGSKQEVMTEAEYKEALKKLDKAMDEAAKKLRSDLESVKMRHSMQNEINEEFFWVHQFSRTWIGDKGTEPKNQAKAAESAVKDLEAVARSRNYQKFEAAMRKAEAAVNDYIRGIEEWISQLTGDAQSAQMLLTYTRDISFVVFGAAAMTVAAPVGLAATLGTGAAVGAGTGTMSGLADEAGRAIASNAKAGDPYDAKGATSRLLKKIGIGALSGMAGAGISKFIGKFVAPKIASWLLSGRQLTWLAQKLVFGSTPFRSLLVRMLDKELAAIASKMGEGVARKMAEGTVLMTVDEASKIAVDVISRFIVRLGPAGVIKVAMNMPDTIKWAENWFQSNAGSVDAAAGGEKIGTAMAKAFEKDPAARQLFDALVENNLKKINAEICVEIRKELKARAKKIK